MNMTSTQRDEVLELARQREADEVVKRGIRLIAYTKANPSVPGKAYLVAKPMQEAA